MVSIIQSNKNLKTVDVTLEINDIFDIINGLNMLVVDKEDEMNKVNVDEQDRIQHKRFQDLLTKMQEVKSLVK